MTSLSAQEFGVLSQSRSSFLQTKESNDLFVINGQEWNSFWCRNGREEPRCTHGDIFDNIRVFRDQMHVLSESYVKQEICWSGKLICLFVLPSHKTPGRKVFHLRTAPIKWYIFKEEFSLECDKRWLKLPKDCEKLRKIDTLYIFHHFYNRWLLVGFPLNQAY